MGGRGFAPDPDNDLQRSRDKIPTMTLRAHDRVYGFDLPTDALAIGERWHPNVVRWWEDWRRSPQAVTMSSATDWHALLVTARLLQDLWTLEGSRGRSVLAAEIRQRMAKFGETHEDRLRLRWSIDLSEPMPIGDPDAPGDVASVSSLDDRRARLGGRPRAAE